MANVKAIQIHHYSEGESPTAENRMFHVPFSELTRDKYDIGQVVLKFGGLEF